MAQPSIQPSIPETIYEGTAQELAAYMAQYPNRRFRLIDLMPENEQMAVEDNTPAISARNAAAIALLDSWIAEDATNDPEEIRKAEEELAEFKRNINANRALTGEGIVFP